MRTYDSRRVSRDVLVRMIRHLRQSPLMYLADSGIWTYRGDESLKLTLADVAAEQKSLIDRAETILIAEQFELPLTAFPLAYTGWHDADLGFLLTRVLKDLEQQRMESDRLLEDADLAVAHGGDMAGRVAECIRESRTALGVQVDMLRQQAAQRRRPPSPAAGSAAE